MELKVSLPREYVDELADELEKEFGDNIKFYEELQKVWMEDALKIISIICTSYEIYEKVKKYLKKKQEEGFPIKKIE